MTQSKLIQQMDIDKSFDPRWKDLYKIGGVAAIISEIVFILVFATVFIWPYLPGTASTESIFITIQNNKLGGLISLDFLLVLGNLFGILLFLALYVSLRQVNDSYALIALVFGLIAEVLIFTARPISELFTLSGLYTAATTAAARSQYLAAGEALLTLFNGTGWIMNTLFGGLSLLTSSFLMLRSNIFGKSTAYVGIITNALVCFFFIPVIGKLFLFLSIIGYMIWYIQLARRFFQMGKSKSFIP